MSFPSSNDYRYKYKVRLYIHQNNPRIDDTYQTKRATFHYDKVIRKWLVSVSFEII